MCNICTKLYFNVDSSPIKSIVITDNNTGIDKKIVDERWIKILFNDYINTVTSEPRKFVARYKITFSYRNQVYILLINSSYVKLDGISYRVNSNIEHFIQSKMLGDK